MGTDIYGAESRNLASLMGLAGKERHQAWRREELGSILRHQLESPLLFDLKRLDGDGQFTMDRQTCWVDGMELHTFGDLFSHPHPPLDLLCLTKEFAKSSDIRDAAPLPSEVATVLYFAAIGVAWLRCDERISRLSLAEIQEGLEWAIRQPWLPSDLRTMLGQAVTSMRTQEI